jgi:cyclophilin family peptidyl-prolyl cis-trans isomerase
MANRIANFDTPMGKFRVELFEDKAPVTTKNFIDLIEGHQLQLTNNADKSRTFAAIYMHDNRLYISEGTVPDGDPPPGLFQQSLGFVDRDGNTVRYADYYDNDYPPPPSARGRGTGPPPAAAK